MQETIVSFNTNGTFETFPDYAIGLVVQMEQASFLIFNKYLLFHYLYHESSET